MMIEKIGNVTLDYKYYPGIDYYCDGEVEDELLQIVTNHQPSEFGNIIEERASWPILYHLSPLRENIVNWIPLTSSMKVLEVGAGCGAITGALAKKAGSVTCIDLSKKRSQINAYRHKQCENITIQVGNFKHIEPTLDCDFDYIFLIGVFEYGQGYMGSDTPYEDFMKILKKHLGNNGRLVIAIENKFGLKYWAGCQEDHLGTYFSGIENYLEEKGVKTFTRNGIEKILKKTEIDQFHFYYPYPDYKFMTTLYSDNRLPQMGELSDNIRNFDRDRLLLFDEKTVFDTIIEEDLFSLYSNSYVVLIGEPLEIVYSKYSNDRAEKFAIVTNIIEQKDGKKVIEKEPLTKAAQEHIKSLEKSYELLSKRYVGSNIKINHCKNINGNMQFEFVNGTSLEAIFDQFIAKNDINGFIALLTKYKEAIDYGKEMLVTDFDLIFGNILVDGDIWNVIDYEWTFFKQIPVEKIMARALYCYLLGSKKREEFVLSLMDNELKHMGISKVLWEDMIQEEVEFQKKVTKQKKSMIEIHKLIGKKVIDPYPNKTQNENFIQKSIQIYEDFGQGFMEKNSYFLSQSFVDGERLELCIPIKNGCRKLRIDPGMEPCIALIDQISTKHTTGNIRSIPIEVSQKLFSKKQDIFETNGQKIDSNLFLFSTNDPNITIKIEDSEVEIKMNISITTVPFL